MMYRKCERCGANLDWGEKCDCGQQEGHGTYSDREKEAYAMAGSIAEKIHCAGLAAASAQFSRMTYKEFKRAYKLPEWVKPEEYYFFSKSFYQTYCWGYEEGEKMKEHPFDKEREKEKRLTGNR